MTLLRKPSVPSARTDRLVGFRQRTFLATEPGAEDAAPRPTPEHVATPARPTVATPVGWRPAPAAERRVDDGPAASATRTQAIACSARVMTIAGDTTAGILLSQLIYWTRRGTEVEGRLGWVFKTARDWEQETGMSWKVQRRARDHLVREGLIEERKQTMPARLEFRLKLDTLARQLGERANLEVGSLSLYGFADQGESTIEQLLGRSFLYQRRLARVFPVHSAMMCSRLLASSRLPIFEQTATSPPQAARHDTARQITRLVSLHRDEWKAETGLSRDQWQTARRNLRDAGVLVERRHNFPRRVDLAVNLSVLADLLRHAGSAKPRARSASHGSNFQETRTGGGGGAGLDRAKQVGGIGQPPNPPSRSPDPTDSNRPILPIAIARSCLYPKALQGSLQTPPLQRDGHAGAAIGFRCFKSFGWGSGGGFESEDLNPVRPRDGGSQPKRTAEQAQVPMALEAEPGLGPIWPSLFTAGDRQQAGAYLARLDRAIQQEVLDEIAWQQEAGKPVRSPVALLRALCAKVQDGAFAPDGAHRVAAGRQKSAENARRRKEEARSADEPGIGCDPSPEVREKLAALRGSLERKQRA